MARGDSEIHVAITGDSKDLIGAMDKADTKSSKFLGSTKAKVGGALVALGTLAAGSEIIGGMLEESDRLGDAISRVEFQLGSLAKPLEDTAGNFSHIGASKQDMLELEAIFSDWGKGAGLAAPEIAKVAEQTAATASAMALLSDKSPEEILGLIEKAAGGSAKAAKELGVSLDGTLTPAAQLDSILLQLKPKLDDATTGAGDLEQKSAELGAKWETLSGEIGPELEKLLAGVTQFILDEVDAIPHAIQGWQMLGGAIEGFGRTALGPLGNVRDALEGIIGLIGQAGDALGGRGSFDEIAITRANRNFNERNHGLTGP